MKRLIRSLNVMTVLTMTLLSITPLQAMNEENNGNEHWELGAEIPQELVYMSSSNQRRSFDLHGRVPMSPLRRSILHHYQMAPVFEKKSISSVDREQYIQQAQDAENYNLIRPLVLQPKEILYQIFSSCVSQDKDKKEALFSDMKNSLKLREVCKKFNSTLTLEFIGRLCKDYDQNIKNAALYWIGGLTGTSNYYIKHLPIFILLHAHAELDIDLLRIAISNRDPKLVALLFERKMDPNVNPDNLFLIETKEIAELFIKHGGNIHVAKKKHYNFNDEYPNVLWKVVSNQDCSAELLELYLTHNVDAKQLHLPRKTSLLHYFVEQNEKYGIKNVDDFLCKATLLLDTLSDMINHQDVDGKTALDSAQEVLVKEKKKYTTSMSQAFEKFIELCRQYGALTGVDIKQQAILQCQKAQENEKRDCIICCLTLLTKNDKCPLCRREFSDDEMEFVD